MLLLGIVLGDGFTVNWRCALIRGTSLFIRGCGLTRDDFIRGAYSI